MKPLFSFLSLLLVCVSAQGATGDATKASLCGYEVAEHDTSTVIARIAAASFDDPQFGFQFPTLASFSFQPRFANQRGRDEGLFLSVQDGVVRTGAARFSDGTLKFLEVDWKPTGMIHDIAVTPAHFDVTSGTLQAPLSAAVDENGVIRLFFSEQTRLAHRVVKARLEAGDKVNVARSDGYYEFELPKPRGEAFKSVDLKEVSPGVVRIFGLTESHIYVKNIDINDAKIMSRDIDWNSRLPYADGRFIRAFSPSAVVVATDHGRIDLYENGKLSPLDNLPPKSWLVSISAYEVAPGERRIATLSYPTDGSMEPTIRLWTGKSFEPLSVAFPAGERPIALSCSGMRPENMALWQDWKNRVEMRSGFLSEAVGDELRRIVVLTRNGSNYQFRGLQGLASGQIKPSAFPWYYVSPKYSKLEKTLAQAGFDVKSLRTLVGLDTDVGDVGSKLALRLKLEYGFEPFDNEKSAAYKGDPHKLVEAWIRRLNSIRDLRLVRSRVAGSISDEGISLSRDQLMVYELMAIDELLTRDHDLVDVIGPEVVPPTDREWLEQFQGRLTDQASFLIQPGKKQVAALKRYYKQYLEGKPWDDFVNPDAVLHAECPELGRALFGLSQYYFGKPYKHLVEDFIAFSDVMHSTGGDLNLWEVLVEYLDSRDPLRKVTNDVQFLHFLKGGK